MNLFFMYFKYFKKITVFTITVIFFVSLDRFLKFFAFSNHDYKLNLIGEILKFNFKKNYHIAFSLPLTGKMLIILIILIIILLILFCLYRVNKGKYGESALLSLIILGASSNLYDRIKYGFVIDYLDLKYFTVFNLADAMIVTGVLLFMATTLFNKKEVN